MSSLPTKKRGLPTRVKMRHDTHFVEELAARHETPVGRLVPLSDLEPDPEQPRSTMGDLSDLVSSIQDKGILEPILVRARPDTDEPSDSVGESGPSLRIIAGERRFRAAQEAGLYEVPIIELDVGEQEAREIALIENLQRKNLTPFEEAEGYRALVAHHGYTHEQAAEALGKSRVVITESLALLQMPAAVQDAAKSLEIESKSLLVEVSKAENEEEMLRLLDEVTQQGLNRDDLRRLRASRAKRSGSKSRRKPYVFKFQAPDKTYSLSMSFRQSTVDKGDLIQALEQILSDLRTSQS